MVIQISSDRSGVQPGPPDSNTWAFNHLDDFSFFKGREDTKILEWTNEQISD